MVQGRVVYEVMEEYWPQAREDASLPDVLREYGEIWTAKPKVLVSRTRHSADHHTRIIGGDDAIEQLAALRAGTDGSIGVGGAALAWPLPLRAQRVAKVPRIGLLGAASASGYRSQLEAFRQGLRDLATEARISSSSTGGRRQA
jgi:hypothetical protein